MEATKYEYNKVIQQHYGQGWEDVSEYETNSQYLFKTKAERELFMHDIKEYRLTGYLTRSICRKSLRTVAA